MRFLILALALVCEPGALFAQDSSAPSNPATPSRRFVGVGFVAGDPYERESSSYEPPRLWHLSSGFPAGKWLAIGAELVPIPAKASLGSGPSYRFTDDTSARLLLGTARLRVPTRSWLAIDALGVAGVLFQHQDWFFTLCGVPGVCNESRGNENARGSAVGWGFDASIGIVPHIAVTGTVRFLSLRRPGSRQAFGRRSDSTDTFTSVFGVNRRVGW